MVFAQNRTSSKASKVGHKKLEKAWALEKEKPMREHKMLAIKLNLRSKFKDTKEKSRTKMQMRIKNKKMTLKWKEILKATCIQNSSKQKAMTKRKDKKNKLMKRWDKSKIKSENKI
jgi:hypothetical protein